jgi:Transposase DDE domain/FtsX-like permease family
MINSKGWLWLRRQGEGIQDQFVTTNLDTLATALYVRTDDLLKESPQLAPCRPGTGINPKLSDAELVTLAVMQALLGFTSEARWLRHARAHLGHLFPYLPQQPGYNKRLRGAASLIRQCIRVLAAGTSTWTDDVWVVDSTPVECGRSRETAKRSDLAGWAEYGYCASHSRYFWGLRLHLVATLGGLPVGFALTGAKADERQVLLAILDADPGLLAQRPGQILIGDKNYYGAAFEAALAGTGARLLRPPSPAQPTCRSAVVARPPDAVLVHAVPGSAGSAALARHVRQYSGNASRPTVPTALVNFGESANFPLLLGGVVTLCAAATLAHLLTVTVWRRRRDSGLLKALGLVRRQVAAVVFWQAATVASVGIVAGVPLGLVAGRAVWRVFALDAGVVAVPVLPGWLISALAAGFLIAALAIAIVPAAAAARSPAGQVLRTE